ncbi:restriction endonuclease subunit S [Acidithiobacillus sp. HP-11]|uniref:restriction endonuclease subunit S n=1 Tax=Acidithiobacillus sp. HP-11 TaxID=2697656 RepID=UPI0018794601|nr:restriction endonuclease subunit S [Acidithiobacillus sp. HP-11]MBE7566639.1 restriction endonuclease subunit S [Acidithiobacillus sp. HP-11]
MSGNEKRPLVPKLRFPEFRNAWQIRKLEEIADFFKGKGISKADIDPRGKTPCIRYGELYTEYNEAIKNVFSRTNVSPSELFLSRANDVIVPASGETKIDIARASCVQLDQVALGGDLNILRPNIDGLFLSYILNGPAKKEIARTAQGDTVVHLYSSQLKLVDLPVPGHEEQQKIADCLASLDDLITLEAQKLGALKTHKKGLMQQLFPAEGETVPRLRFPAFLEVGNISILPLTAVADLVSEKISIDQITTWVYVSTENILPDFGSIRPAVKLPSVSSVTSFKPNDILVSNIRPYLKKIWQSNIFGGASNDVLVIRAKENIDAGYLAAILRSDLFIEYVMRGAKGVKMPRGELSMIQEFPVACPCSGEQQKIANCLSSLGDLITAQAQKVEALKTHKKGLMQQLFPMLAEVDA